MIKLQQYSEEDDLSIYKSESIKSSQNQSKNNGKWLNQENLRYFVFIHYFQKKIKSKLKRRTNKVFKHMSKYIPTRNAIQCRSHHQKMQKRFGDIEAIIKYFKVGLDLQKYQKIHKQIKEKANNFKKNLEAGPSIKILKNKKTFKEAGTQTQFIQVQQYFVKTVQKCSKCGFNQLINKQKINSYSIQSSFKQLQNQMKKNEILQKNPDQIKYEDEFNLIENNQNINIKCQEELNQINQLNQPQEQRNFLQSQNYFNTLQYFISQGYFNQLNQNFCQQQQNNFHYF